MRIAKISHTRAQLGPNHPKTCKENYWPTGTTESIILFLFFRALQTITQKPPDSKKGSRNAVLRSLSMILYCSLRAYENMRHGLAPKMVMSQLGLVLTNTKKYVSANLFPKERGRKKKGPNTENESMGQGNGLRYARSRQFVQNTPFTKSRTSCESTH